MLLVQILRLWSMSFQQTEKFFFAFDVTCPFIFHLFAFAFTKLNFPNSILFQITKKLVSSTNLNTLHEIHNENVFCCLTRSSDWDLTSMQWNVVGKWKDLRSSDVVCNSMWTDDGTRVRLWLQSNWCLLTFLIVFLSWRSFWELSGDLSHACPYC